MVMVSRPAWLAAVLLFSAMVVTTRADACLASSVSVGVDFSCALLTDGSARCWGNSANGRLGRPTNFTVVNTSGLTGPPLDFGVGRSAVQLTAHADYTCALLADHSVVCWGRGWDGALGTGDTDDRPQPTPIQLGLVNQTVPLLSTGGSSRHVCIATSGGQLITWGKVGEMTGTPWLGTVSSVADTFFTPHQVNFSLGHDVIPAGVSICSGAYHTCVMSSRQGVKCWGADKDGTGELGLGKVIDTTGFSGETLPPVNLGTGGIAVAMSCGHEHTCVILDNGVLKCWGSNDHGQLGYGDTTNRGASDADMGDNLLGVDVGTGRTVKQVSGGTWHTCAILDNGQVKCWGKNDVGQLGHNCPTSSSSPTTWGDLPNQMGDKLPFLNLGPNRTAVSLSGSDSHTCAVLDNGSIKCWGDLQFGQLGFFGGGGCGPSVAVDLGFSCLASSVVLRNATADGNNSTRGASNSTGNSTGSDNHNNNSTGGNGADNNRAGVNGGVSANGTNSPSLVQQSVSPASSSSQSVSGGTIAGAVVACVVAVALIGAGVWWLRTKQGSSRQLAGATGAAAGVGAKQQSAGVVVVAADEAVANGLEEGLAHTTVDVQQDTGCCTWPTRSTTSTSDAKGTSNKHNTPSSGLPSTALSSEGSVEGMRIPWSHLIVGRVLGEGGFGTVYKARWQSETVAVKLLNVRKTSKVAISNLYREALIMGQLRHPCIARVFGVVDEDPHYALVMQYYQKGTLAQYMTTPAFAGLTFPIKLHIARQIASGMRFMHERTVPILHGDLKAANILLTGPGRQIAIADFGLSQALLAGQEAAVASGALTYSISPPEVLEDPLAPRTRAADVYAFAIVLLEIYTGKRAFGNLWPKDIRVMVTTGGRPALPADMPVCIATIIQSCWAQDPAARPSFAVVAQQLTAAYEDLQLTHLMDSTKTLDGTHTMTDW